MDIKIGSHTFHLTLTAIALVAGGLFVFIKMGGNSVAIDAALAGAKQELASHASWLQRFKADSDTLKLEQKKLSSANAAETALKGKYNAYVQQHPTTVRDTDVAILMATVAACDSAKRASGQIVTTDSIRVESISYQDKQVADTLAHLEQTEECHLISVGAIKLFGCPSRFSAFKDGGVVGIITGFILRGL